MNKFILRAVGLGEEVDAVEAGRCPFCKQSIMKGSFRDALSEKKFQISGLCQKCQDETFNEMEG